MRKGIVLYLKAFEARKSKILFFFFIKFLFLLS